MDGWLEVLGGPSLVFFISFFVFPVVKAIALCFRTQMSSYMSVEVLNPRTCFTFLNLAAATVLLLTWNLCLTNIIVCC